MTKLCIDLCSGLGGFSQAFVDAGWEVVTVDIDPSFNPTVCADILTLSASDIETKTKLRAFSAYEKVVVVASPPCERFSRAHALWPKKGIRKALEIAGACIELIINIQPKYWCLENPKARLRWFIGEPPHSVQLSDYGHNGAGAGRRRNEWGTAKPTDLWGNIPFPMVEAQRLVKLRGPNEGGPRAKKAEMPYGLSQAILEAVDPEIKLAGEPSSKAQSPSAPLHPPKEVVKTD